jgi:GTPase SAR1 family protein
MFGAAGNAVQALDDALFTTYVDVLFLGLDNAGKTTTIYILSTYELSIHQPIHNPTINMTYEKICQIGNLSLYLTEMYWGVKLFKLRLACIEIEC